MASQGTDYPKFRAGVAYSTHSKLNTLQVCQLQPRTDGEDTRVWIVYVHGGAWFDPDQTAATFDKAQALLLSSSVAAHVAGLASINYRLSPPGPSVSIPYDPSDPARNAKHPDHINDVLDAISWLEQTYQFRDRYILVGHSCGAALVFQVAMRRRWPSNSLDQGREEGVPAPVALLGLEGLYDLPALVRYHSSEPLYVDFVTSAFGKDEAMWKAVSPTASELETTWKNGQLAVLAHSHEDELVEWEQVDLMHKSLHSQGFATHGSRRVYLLELKGKHDQVWGKGTEVARAIEYTVRQLFNQTM